VGLSAHGLSDVRVQRGTYPGTSPADVPERMAGMTNIPGPVVVSRFMDGHRPKAGVTGQPVSLDENDLHDSGPVDERAPTMPPNHRQQPFWPVSNQQRRVG
jgi:hypothetical protein